MPISINKRATENKFSHRFLNPFTAFTLGNMPKARIFHLILPQFNTPNLFFSSIILSPKCSEARTI